MPSSSDRHVEQSDPAAAHPPPSTSLGDLARLGSRIVWAAVTHARSFSLRQELWNWLRKTARRRQSENLVLDLLVTKILFVGGRDLSEHILADPPHEQCYVEGDMKRQSMSVLAPQALTISHGEKWQRLRRFNTQVLDVVEDPVYRETFLRHVRRAFSTPVRSVEDVRTAMGRANRAIVFGDGIAPDHISKDIQALFSYVQNPLKRILLGWWAARRRARLYENLRQLWQQTSDSEEPSLIAAAHRHADGLTKEETIQQIPHWMFTFTGSGTDFLVRALALVATRPEVRTRARNEIAAAGPLDKAEVVEQLPFLEACLREAAHLFPPVTQTFHCAPHGDTFNGLRVPSDMEVMHVFPLPEPGTDSEPGDRAFRPERWLDDDSPSPAFSPFLGGARSCPGESLILVVCKLALALLLGQQRLEVSSATLATDPLPLAFPEEDVRIISPS